MKSVYRLPVIQIILALAVVVLAIALYRQRAETLRAERKIEALKDGGPAPAPLPPPPARPQGAGAHAAPAIAAGPSPESVAQPPPVAQATPAPQPHMVMTPSGFAPEPRSEGLTLAGTHVAPVEGGLRASMRFNPTITEPLGIVAVVVRLPVDGEARILDLAPAGSLAFRDVAMRVSEDGKFAVFQGTADVAAAAEFALSVSAPAVADVRGTCGIGAFDLRIGPTGASATPK